MEEEKKKNPHAVAMGRRGGKVKSQAKTAACRLNGWLGGAAAWKKPRKPHDQWKRRTFKPKKRKKMIVVVAPPPPTLTAIPIIRRPQKQILVREYAPR